MRLISFVSPEGVPRAGVLLGNTVVDLATAAPLALEEAEDLHWDMLSLLRADQEEVNLETAADILAAVVSMAGGELDEAEEDGDGDLAASSLAGSLSIGGAAMLFPLEQVRLLAPLPNPPSLREFYAFEGHAEALFRLSGSELPGAWYRGPAFQFGNHRAILGPGAEFFSPRIESLDYGLCLACVIGREGYDLAPEEASSYIAGYCLLNAWMARDRWQAERPLGFGSAKARDFATSLGPWLVTADELELYTDDDGRLSLSMTSLVNGAERSRGNAASMNYTFAELIARASQNVTLYPGDLLSSGPITGSTLFELTEGYGPWLEPGDSVELQATGLGSLRNSIL
jgi:fumarylacetoacetate (FAA) hydrolase